MQAQSVLSNVADLLWHIISGTFQLILTAEITLLMPVLWVSGNDGHHSCAQGAVSESQVLPWLLRAGLARWVTQGSHSSPAPCPPSCPCGAGRTQFLLHGRTAVRAVREEQQALLRCQSGAGAEAALVFCPPASCPGAWRL